MLGMTPQMMVPKNSIVGEYSRHGECQLTGSADQRNFSPYSDNHGSVVAIAGSDYAVIASDTRLSAGGYTILTREQPKLFQLTRSIVLGSTGCWCDVLTFVRQAELKRKLYALNHGSGRCATPKDAVYYNADEGDVEISTEAFAQMVSNMLYYKRFFPYYVSNVLAGIDKEGHGVVYSYDPVGSSDKHAYRASGTSVALLQPLLDSQVGKKNMGSGQFGRVDEHQPHRVSRKTYCEDLTVDEACNLIHDLFVSAAEREIHTGDAIAYRIITRESGVVEKTLPLRRD